jgi:hypothetical protein
MYMRGNIKMSLKEAGCEGMKWIHLAQDTVQWQGLMSTVKTFWVT